MERIVECVPNFSEGRNQDTIAALVAAIKSVTGVFLLDQEMDSDHHRAVLTFAGVPAAVAEAAYQVTRVATSLIDLRGHRGGHPRVGATDVVPFVPIKGATMEDCVTVAREVGSRIATELHIPVFLYERAASADHRRNLENIRKGGLESLAERMHGDPDWAPDFGPPALHPTAGATIVGARAPLIAFNVNLQSGDVNVAKAIAKKVRFSSGGLPYVKAMGVELATRGLVQVSMNLTNFEETPIHVAFEAVKREAEERGIQVLGSEVVGLVPEAALLHAAARCLKLEGFDRSQVLETRLERAMAGGLPEQGIGGRGLRSAGLSDMTVSVIEFLEALSAGTPTPGGGSVAAFAGALAASLGVMACRIGPSKQASTMGSGTVAQNLSTIERRLLELRARLQSLVPADAEAYERVLRAYRLPKTEPGRAQAISIGLQVATQVPLETATLAAETVTLLRDVRPRVKPAVSTDLEVGIQIGIAAIEGARANVLANLNDQTNQGLVATVSAQLKDIEQRLAEVRSV
jgi:glutamate formiminotransferase/glutamate formiminotransferase/formiminotetrahydrofolate cyclodeaminase